MLSSFKLKIRAFPCNLIIALLCLLNYPCIYKYMQWDPPTVEQVSQDMVDQYFSPLSEFEPDLELPTNLREAFTSL